MTVLCQNYVLGLQVSENNFVLVEVLDGYDDLADVEPRFLLRHFLLQLYLLTQVSTRAKLHDQVEPVGILEREVEPYDERVGPSDA